MDRPTSAETAPYYQGYIDLVPDGDIVEQLADQGDRTRRALEALRQERGLEAYAEGKWSVNELVLHLADTERMFAYRALAFARRDRAALPGMDQDQWNRASGANDRPLANIVEELAAVRVATVALFGGMDPAVGVEVGEASGARFTVRSLAWIIAGHELHHLGVLRERYGVHVATD